MAAEAIFRQDGESIDFTPTVAVTGGQVIQLRDGRVGFAPNDIAANKQGAIQVAGIVRLLKTAGIVLLKGGKAFWDYSANTVHFKPVNDRDYLIGAIQNDAASADTTVDVALNVNPRYIADLALDPFTTANVGTAAAGAAGFGGPKRYGGTNKLLISATSEAQKVDALGRYGFLPAALPIVEMEVNNVNNGAGGSQDFNIGLASGTHASDADAITNSIFLHIDGASLVLNFQSKDGTTTVASTSSTVSCVAGTPFEVWMDCRDLTSIKFYVDGVRVLSGTTYSFAAGVTTLFLLAHLEKTTGVDVFDIDVNFLRARIADQ